MRSKNISDYFEAKLSDIRPWITLDFDIHLYFSQNQHMMTLCPKNEAPSDEFLQKYRSKKVEKIWIHREDEFAYQCYLTSRTQEGAMLAALLNSNSPEESAAEQKKIIMAAAAQELVNKLGAPTSPQEQKEANQQLKQVIRDVLDKTALRSESAISDLLNLCDADPELTHAANVATFAATFAMAFGRIEADLISDIALAGLLHDVGISHLSLDVVSTPITQMDKETLEEYSGHVNIALKLIEKYSQKIPDRVKALIEQHHEKFDGTGYPQRLQGQKVNDIAQIIAMADMIDTISSGRFDGTERTLKNTIEFLKELEGSKPKPEYFHPAIFKAIMNWVSSTEANENTGSISETVGHQASQVMRN